MDGYLECHGSSDKGKQVPDREKVNKKLVLTMVSETEGATTGREKKTLSFIQCMDIVRESLYENIVYEKRN